MTCSIGELVHDGVNGRLFETAPELCQHLQSLLRGVGDPSASLCQFATSLRSYVAPANQWDASWTAIAQPLFK